MSLFKHTESDRVTQQLQCVTQSESDSQTVTVSEPESPSISLSLTETQSLSESDSDMHNDTMSLKLQSCGIGVRALIAACMQPHFEAVRMPKIQLADSIPVTVTTHASAKMLKRSSSALDRLQKFIAMQTKNQNSSSLGPNHSETLSTTSDSESDSQTDSQSTIRSEWLFDASLHHSMNQVTFPKHDKKLKLAWGMASEFMAYFSMKQAKVCQRVIQFD
jgi:hypothetical protein